MNLHTIAFIQRGMWLDARGTYHNIASMEDRRLLNILGRFLPRQYLTHRRSEQREAMLMDIVREARRRNLPIGWAWSRYS